jgi:hypothetical protein
VPLALPLYPLFTEVPRRGQAVEKVGIELKATTNKSPNVPKAACLVPDLGSKRAYREFFYSLRCSRKFGTLSLAAVVALAITGPEQPPLLLRLPTTRNLSVLLVPAGVGLVEAASLLTLEATCPLHQPSENPRHPVPPNLG